MATTTKATTTTSTEPPSTIAPVRRRPGRRPLRRRRPVDYYYEDDDDYDAEYYEERVNRRRKQRPRSRKPLTDYEEEYDEDKRHPISRDRQHDEELDDDYETERRKYDRPRSRNKSDTRAERRKLTGRRSSSTVGVRIATDERRSLSEEKANRKDKPLSDETLDVADPPRRPVAGGRWRISGERQHSPNIEDDYEKPQEEEVAADQPAIVKPASEQVKPDMVRPQSGGTSSLYSIYDRPRAAPRVSRPVPINEKKKFQYVGQKKTSTTTAPAPIATDEEYYDDVGEEYDDVRGGHPESAPRSGYHDNIGGKKLEDDESLPPRKIADPPRPLRKPIRPNSRKPLRERRPLIDDEYYEEPVSTGKGGSHRRRPLKDRSTLSVPSGRGNQDVDFVDEDYDDLPRDHRPRKKVLPRKQLKKDRTPLPDDDQPLDAAEERPLRSRDHQKTITNQRNNSNRHQIEDAASPIGDEEEEIVVYEEEEKEKPKESQHTTRTPVRIVKRPFLPSRGGSPYLPRGLQPVGGGGSGVTKESSTTFSTPIDMGSTISGSRLLEHGAPLLRNTGPIEHVQKIQTDTATITSLIPKEITTRVTKIPPTHNTVQQQHHDITKVSLDELYETDYDVTLNDALNPTLKPIAPSSNRNYPSAFTTLPNHDHNSNHYDRNFNYNHNNIRRRTVLAPPIRNTRTEYVPGPSSRIAQHFYDDNDYQ